MRWPDGTWQPSRRRFPTIRGTLVRRTPLRRLRTPYEKQRDHYQLDERPAEPVQADWMLGAFLLMRRAMLDEIGGWDAGFRHYCEDIDLCYRAAEAGWERWYVPSAVVTHDYAAVIDQQVPLPAHALARARDGPLRAQASGAPARAVPKTYAARREDWTRARLRRCGDVSRAPRRSRRRARADARSRRRGARPRLRRRRPRRGSPRARPSLPRRRLDSGDGGRGESTAGRSRLHRARRPERVRAACARRRDDGLPRDLLRRATVVRSSSTSQPSPRGSSSST